MNEILEDKKVKKALLTIRTFGTKTDIWVDELITLQSTLPVKALNVSALLQSSQHKLIESNIQNQSHRSRAVTIKMNSFKEYLTIKQTLDRVRGYILASHGESLRSVSKTITERKAYVDYLLERWRKIETNLDMVVKLSDMVIEDCDANGYTLMRIQNTLEQKGKDR